MAEIARKRIPELSGLPFKLGIITRYFQKNDKISQIFPESDIDHVE
jgi:hypothetical protein